MFSASANQTLSPTKTTLSLNGSLAGIRLQDLFHIQTVNLSVAVWVGFIALFGVATDDDKLIVSDQHFNFIV